jgi:predicted SAM-dependent methyltransferase
MDTLEYVRAREHKLFQYVIDHPDLSYVNLGSGNRVIQGFKNYDKYVLNNPDVKYMDIAYLPLPDSSVDVIFCAHALEHLPLSYTDKALREMHRVLKTDGWLYLSVPDLKAIMTILLHKNLNEKEKNWYLRTLYGYQHEQNESILNENTPVAPGEFHCSGFFPDQIKIFLEKLGMEVEQVLYDGCGTPGLYYFARKIN